MKVKLRSEWVRGEHDGVPFEIELIHPQKWCVQTVTTIRGRQRKTRTPRQHSWDTRDQAIEEAMGIVCAMTGKV